MYRILRELIAAGAILCCVGRGDTFWLVFAPLPKQVNAEYSADAMYSHLYVTDKMFLYIDILGYFMTPSEFNI